MKVQMVFKHMDATDALKNRANEKSEKLKRFISEATECHWVFYLEGDVHVADLRVSGPHIDHFVQAKTSDMYQSIDQCVEKLEKKLRKQKEIVKDHLHRNRASG